MRYWREHPPHHLLMQGVAGGLSGVTVGNRAPSIREDVSPTEVRSGADFLKMVQGSGVEVGVLHE
jgi:hypothetical protein